MAIAAATARLAIYSNRAPQSSLRPLQIPYIPPPASRYGRFRKHQLHRHRHRRLIGAHANTPASTALTRLATRTRETIVALGRPRQPHRLATWLAVQCRS